MATVREWMRRLSGSLRRDPGDGQFEEELRLHVELAGERARRDGASPDEAQRTARLQAGGIAQTVEAMRDQRGFPWLDDLARDTRHGLRALRRNPTFTLVALLTLALGIGATTAMFSVVEGVLLRPLPYPDEGRLVRVWATIYASRDNEQPFSPRGYWHFVNNNRSFEKFGGLIPIAVPYPLTGDGPPLQINTGVMTSSAFDVVGVFPERGRLPTPEESAPRGPSVVLLSHDLWVGRFGADPSILGRLIDLNGTRRVVIGIMPASYEFPTPEVDAWIPFELDPASELFGAHFISAIARLKPGVTIEAATDDARSLIARFSELGYAASWFKDTFDGGAVVRPLREQIVVGARRPLLVVFGTAGFVLLIACSNVANLLLVRAEGRRQEHAVRMALGSGRGRLVRQMLVESAVLALMGGAAGALLAYVGLRVLVWAAPASIPRLDAIGINGAALAFTAVVSVLAGLLFGVLPALRASSTRVTAALRDGGRSAASGGARHRTRNALVMTQVALAVVLVIGSGLMVRSFQALRSVDPGFSADGVLTFEVRPLPTKYVKAEAMAQFYDRLIERLEAVPGVTRAGAIDALPLTGGGLSFRAVIEEFPPPADELAPIFKSRRTAPGYFEAMGIPLIEGRTFTSDDHTRRLPSVIISNSIKARYWPDESALGKRITSGPISARVVGVVGDVHDSSLDGPAGQFLYLPIVNAAGGGVSAMRMAVHTAVEPLSLTSAIRSAIAEVDRDLPLAKVQSMERVLGDSMSRTSFTMSVLVIAALVALFLGAVGIYGVLSYVVSLRTPEIGTRLALGASPGAVLRMVLSQGMRLAGVGVLLGLVVALVLGHVIAALLYGVSPVDAVTIVAASAIFLAVAVVASLLPAARAARTAPVDALRAR